MPETVRSQLTGMSGVLAVTIGFAFVFISAGALVGAASTPSATRVTFVVLVTMTAVALGPPSGSWKAGAFAGIAIGLIGLVGSEFTGTNPSFGLGQTGAAFGALISVPVLRRAWAGSWVRFTPVLGALVVGLVLVALIRTVLDGGALGHDESAYALKARAWLFGTPDTGWQLHRAPLLSLLGIPVVAVTEDETFIRLIGVGTAVFALFAATLVGHSIGGRWVALLTTASVGASLAFLRRGSEYLTDVPSAGILLLIVWIVLGVVKNPEVNNRIVLLLGPLVAAAFYMRYQSVLAILGIGIGAAVAWPQVVNRLRRTLMNAAAIAIALIIPHFIWATVVTGRPWGIVLVTSDAAGRAFLGEGLVDYASMFPFDLAGIHGALLMALGFGWLIWAIVRSSRSDSANAVFVIVVMATAVIPLGLVAHGEPRFVFFPVWLLIAVGSLAVVKMVRVAPPRGQFALVLLAVLLWLPLVARTGQVVDRNAEARGQSFAILIDASNSIRGDVSANSCDVLTTYQPQVTWYTSCYSELMRQGWDPAGFADLPGDDEFVLLFENGKRQPSDAEERYGDLGVNTQVSAATPVPGDATIIALP